MNELEQHITQFFGAFNSEDLTKITALFNETRLQKNALVLKTGKYCKEMLFIKSGLIRLYTLVDGKEVTQWISTPGYFAFDISSFMFDTPSKWTLQALDETRVYSISKKDYEKLHLEIPRWKDVERMFLGKCFSIIEERIFSHLSMTAEERYNAFFLQNPTLFNQVPLQYIASMLGMTPETFSRIRKKLHS